VFAVIAEKSRQISDPATFSRSIRPLPPRQVSVSADFERVRFRVLVELSPDEESHTEKCQITVDAEQQSRERLEQIVPVHQRGSGESGGGGSSKSLSSSFADEEEENTKTVENPKTGGGGGNNKTNVPFCAAFMDLVPGKRYEISATAISGNVSSTRVLRNRAIEPGFDFARLGTRFFID
jgi:hypothetical protein